MPNKRKSIKRMIETLYHKALILSPKVVVVPLTAERIERAEQYRLRQENEYETAKKKHKLSNENEFSDENLNSRKEPLQFIESTEWKINDQENNMNTEKNNNQQFYHDYVIDYNVQDTNFSNPKNNEQKKSNQKIRKLGSQRSEYETVVKKHKSSNENEFTDENLNISKEPSKLIESTNSEKNDMNTEKNNDKKCDHDNVVDNNVQYTNYSNTKNDEQKSDQDDGTQYMLGETFEELTNKSLEDQEFSKFGKVSVCDSYKMIDPLQFEKFCLAFSQPIITKKEEKIPAVIIPNSQDITLAKIECLYQKYFIKSVHINTMIIANILNIISLSNLHFKTRMDESLKIKCEIEKSITRSDASKIHQSHTEVLKIELNKYFLKVILEFPIPEFETVFQMFFWCLLTEHRALDQKNFKRNFKNLNLLLLSSVNKSKLHQINYIFAMLKKANTFRAGCQKIVRLIEDGQESDPGIIHRLPQFFKTSLNDKKYFQVVIDAVTNDFNGDLMVLIENCIIAFHCSICSKFESSTDLPLSSITEKKNNVKMSVSTRKFTPKDDRPVKKWVVLKFTRIEANRPPSETDPNPQKKSPASLENGKSSQQLNSLDNSVSDSLARVFAENNVVITPQSTVEKTPAASPENGKTSQQLNSLDNSVSDSLARVFAENNVVITPQSTVEKTPAASPENGKTSQQLNSLDNSVSDSLARVFAENNVVITPQSTVEKTPAASPENGKTSQQLNSLDKSVSDSLARVFAENNVVITPQSTVENPVNIPPKITMEHKSEVPLRITVLKKVFNASLQNKTPLKQPIPRTHDNPRWICSAENCHGSAEKIICGECNSVKYCTLQCQISDWHKTHKYNCDRLKEEYYQSTSYGTNECW